ncbi:MAG: DNA recombination protein RmuC [Actinomycetota bacterium]|nr:DNA recombination protein RmuC [Actinomycetota bacterium]
MNVVLAVVVAVLAIAVVVLVVLLGRRSRAQVEVPEDVNRDVLDRLAQLEGGLNARLQSVDERVGGVTSLFANPQGRGGWGELSLRQAFEHAGLVEGRDYTIDRVDGVDGRRPDGVVKLPDGRKIIVDAKFPIARFAEAEATEDAAERSRLLDLHGKSLVEMARGLERRGYRSEAAGGYVVMYVPDEGLYVEAMRARPTLFDEIRHEGVLLAGPVTLLALLGVTAQVIGEHRAVAEAREIVAETKELHTRLAKFAKHLGDVGKKLNTAVNGYNSAVGSWEARLEPQARRVADHVLGGEIPGPAPIDTIAREVSVGDEDQFLAAG